MKGKYFKMSKKLINPNDLSQNNNSSLEVVVKRADSANDEMELDLMNVFSNMGKKKRIYIWVIILSVLIGLFVPILIFYQNKKIESVSAVLTFTYPLATNLKAPDNTDLDVGFIMSSHIVQRALSDLMLSDKLSISSVSSNINVKRMLADETLQQLEILERFDSATLNTTNTDSYVNMVNGIEYSYKPQYIISLENGFRSGNGSKKIFLSGEDLSNLLNHIISEYKLFFFETYEEFEIPDNRISDVSLSELDYIEWLDSISEILDSLNEYCKNTARYGYLNFRSPSDGISFNDISRIINLIKKVRIEYIYSFVYYNYLSKDSENTVTKFDYKLRELNRSLEVINSQIKNGAILISNYKNDNILVARQKNESEEPSELNATSVTDYYNGLILNQASLFKKRSDLQLIVKNITDKRNGFSKKTGSAKNLETAEKEMGELENVLQSLYELIKFHAEEIVESISYTGSFISSIDAVYTSSSIFSKDSLIKLATGAGIGFFIGLLLWGLDGLILEFKNSNLRAKYGN